MLTIFKRDITQITLEGVEYKRLGFFFDFLKGQGIFEENPLKDLINAPKFIDIPRPAILIDIKTVWTHQLLETKSSSGKLEELISLRNQIITLLIFGAALKVSDLAALKREHLIRSSNETRILITQNKKKDPYTIAMPIIFHTLISKYLKLLDFFKQKANIDFDDLLFNANPFKILNGGISPRGVELVFKHYSKKLSISITPKSLRQAAIFKWIHQKYSDSQIREWLGVTPSYDLSAYHHFAKEYIYNDEFLNELYLNYLQQN
jgi:site-specific recombinase XerD